jgi:hypothetical protein
MERVPGDQQRHGNLRWPEDFNDECFYTGGGSGN